MSAGRPTCAALALLGCLASAGCPDKSAGFVLVKNVCTTNADCVEDTNAAADAGVAVCNETTLQCEREAVEAPYELILQVRSNNTDLGLVEQFTYEAFTLEGPRTDYTLDVPLAVNAEGIVSWKPDGGAKALESEVTFVPVPDDSAAPVNSTVVQTLGAATASEPNLRARLAPDTNYRVRVQPLLDESAQLPPRPFPLPPLSVEDGGVAIIEVPAYEAMDERSARLVDEFGAPIRFHRIRLEDKVTGEVLSSTTETKMDGSFTLFALPKVMDGQGFNVVVSLPSFPRWRVKIAIDGSKLIQGVPLVLPVIPDTVEVAGAIEARDPPKDRGPAGPSADIIFVSNFPVPDGAGDAQGADWCRWQRVSSDPNHPPRCSATIAITADRNGRYSVPLLPGVYDAFVVPSNQPGGPSVYRTSLTQRTFLSQSSGTHDGQTLYLDRAARYEGMVVSFRGEPMPNVTVSARSLVSQQLLPKNEVYQYARSAVAVTDDRGRFFLNVDLGYFDLSVEPPAETGFPWVQNLNREISEDAGALAPDAGTKPVQLTPLVSRAPVIVAGRVIYAGDSPLAGATVEAFALVESITRGRRAVRIAHTVSDKEGNYRLALPPEVRAQDAPDAGADADHSE